MAYYKKPPKQQSSLYEDNKKQHKGQTDFMASDLYKGKIFQNKWKR